MRAPIQILSLLAVIATLGSLSACWQIGENGGAAAPVDTSLKRYIGQSTKQCATIRFVCEPNETYFSDKKGCGCEKKDVDLPEAATKADPLRHYVGNSPEECAAMRFTCGAGEKYFADDKGCGCEGGAEDAPESESIDKKATASAEKATASAEKAGANACSAEERKAEFCAEIYAPVCGLFDPAQIQCIKAPCGQTFSNRCEACRDRTVLTVSDGECAP